MLGSHEIGIRTTRKWRGRVNSNAVLRSSGSDGKSEPAWRPQDLRVSRSQSRRGRVLARAVLVRGAGGVALFRPIPEMLQSWKVSSIGL
jgi:hypothetical protein